MQMKNRVIITLTVATMLLAQAGTALADSTINVYLKGKLQTFEQSAIIKDGSTLVPMRAIFEALGATVKWDAKQQIIDATKDDKIIRLQIGWKGAWIGETKVALDVAPQIINGSTMVPLRFIGEALGEKVEWDSTSRSVLISTDKSQLPKADSGVYKGYATVMRPNHFNDIFFNQLLRSGIENLEEQPTTFILSIGHSSDLSIFCG